MGVVSYSWLTMLSDIKPKGVEVESMDSAASGVIENGLDGSYGSRPFRIIRSPGLQAGGPIDFLPLGWAGGGWRWSWLF